MVEEKVNDGYKRTEVGVIPSEWNSLKVEECVSIKTGSRNTQDKIDEGIYPFFVRSQQVENINSYSYDCEAVLTAGDGVGTGKVFHYINGKFDAHQRVYIMTNFKDITGKYFYYYFSNYFYNEVIKYTAKTSVDSVRRDMIAKMLLPIPTLNEQKSIAESIEEIDNLLQSLEKLIDKKKKIKQGTMQQLLTGKKRLTGFSSEWENIKVKDFGMVLTGGTPPTDNKKYWNGIIPWVTPSDINESKNILNSEREITLKGLSYLNILPPNTVLVTCIASIGKNAILKETGSCNQQINAIVPNSNFNADYIYYLMESKKSYLLANAGTTATSIISKKEFSELEFTVPKKDEQVEISKILSNMDSEIEALQLKLEKYKKIKQGMMQELLTGRIRLI